MQDEKKTSKVRTVKKTTSKKKAVRKKAVSKKQMKKPVAKTVSTPLRNRKKVARKSTATTGGRSGDRRGRPVSLEVLQRRLETAEKTLRLEKEKRRKLAQSSKQRVAVALTAKKALKTELAKVKQTLATLLAEQKGQEREERRKQKMIQARDAAVAGFMERWEKKHDAKQAATTPGRRKKVRGRPRKA